jgi:hypothetical protein
LHHCKILVFCFLTLFIGCKKSAPEAEVKHELGTPVAKRGDFEPLWAQYDQAGYVSYIKRKYSNQIKILDKSDPLVLRANFWVRTLDDLLREKYQQDLRGIPVPVVSIVDRSSLNAFVTVKRICHPRVEVHISGAEGSAVIKDNLKILKKRGCDETRSPTKREFQFVYEREKSNLRRRYASCHTTEKSYKNQRIGFRCEQRGGLAKNRAGRGYYSPRVRPEITVFKGVFSLEHEWMFVSILLHELAHYYRAHVFNHEDGVSLGQYYDLKNRGNHEIPPALVISSPLYGDVIRLKSMVRDLLKNSSSKVKKEYAELTKSSSENGLGLYSKEQEADEWAAEMLHELKLSPLYVARTFAEISVMKDPKHESNCVEKLLDNWNNGSEFEPVGDFHDKFYKTSHHSICFRAFGVNQDIHIHGYHDHGAQKWAADFEHIRGYVEQGGRFSWRALREMADAD